MKNGTGSPGSKIRNGGIVQRVCFSFSSRPGGMVPIVLLDVVEVDVVLVDVVVRSGGGIERRAGQRLVAVQRPVVVAIDADPPAGARRHAGVGPLLPSRHRLATECSLGHERLGRDVALEQPGAHRRLVHPSAPRIAEPSPHHDVAVARHGIRARE